MNRLKSRCSIHSSKVVGQKASGPALKASSDIALKNPKLRKTCFLLLFKSMLCYSLPPITFSHGWLQLCFGSVNTNFHISRHRKRALSLDYTWRRIARVFTKITLASGQTGTRGNSRPSTRILYTNNRYRQEIV